MKITLSKQTSEILWGFAKSGIHVSIRPRCEKCKKWVKLTARKVEK